MKKTKIVILGAGYGGLMTTVQLQRNIKRNEADIVLINQHHYHYETTWLHETSAGTLCEQEVTYRIEDVIDGKKVQLIEDTVKKIDAKKRQVILANGSVDYDYLVIALGGETEAHGIKGLNTYGYTISNVETAKKINAHIEKQFSLYTSEKAGPLLKIVVGGAGFTGIEFVGELTESIPRLCKKYGINEHLVEIHCVERAQSILPGFDSELANYAQTVLEKRGVHFHTNTAIKECTEDGVVVVQDEQLITLKAGTVVWTAGVKGSSVIADSGFDHKRNRIAVDLFLRMPEYENIFVIGDCSIVVDEKTNRPIPPTAQLAMQQGKLTAKNLLALIRGDQDLDDFVFDNKGAVCSLGSRDAIGIVFGKKINGYFASLMKKVIDNRALLLIGGLPLMLKKGKFKIW